MKTASPQQDIEFSIVLIDGSPQQLRLAAQRYQYLVTGPCRAGLAARRFHTACEARTELIAPASDCFVADDNPALEQLFDITQAEHRAILATISAT